MFKKKSIEAAQQPTQEPKLGVWLKEYEQLTADIRARVDLQQRNGNLAVVFFIGTTGFLITWASSHGLASSLNSGFALLIAAIPIASSIFVWRHIDYDSDIIAKANYIELVIRPAVAAYADDRSVLGFESYLRQERRAQFSHLSPITVLGNDHIINMLFEALYLVVIWIIRIFVLRMPAILILYDGLAALATLLFAVNLAVSVISVTRFATIPKAYPK